MNRTLFGNAIRTLQFNMTAIDDRFYATSVSNFDDLLVTDGKR